MSDPLVSVIMNCYNCDRYLKEAIDSVYAQTYKNWEIIFWDNASSDGAAQIAQSYDSRLKYYRAEETTILGKARVLAVDKAKGKYIAFLDCDDLWLPKKLSKQVDIFTNSKVELGIVYGRCEFFYSDSKNNSYILRDGKTLPEGMVFEELAKENFIPFLSAIVERGMLQDSGGFPSHLQHSTDYWVFMHMAEKYPVGAVQEVCCKYRIHNDNLSNSLNLKAAQESVEIVSKFLPDKDAAKGLKYQYVKLVIAYLKEGMYRKALTILVNNGGWSLLILRLVKKLF